MSRANYIADTNPFRLAEPPTWWLSRLADFDRDLVVIPSRERPVHWLARRQKYSMCFTGQNQKADGRIYDPAPDTQMFVTHRVISVSTLIFHSTSFSENSLLAAIAWLKERDTWSGDEPLDDRGVQSAISAGGTKFTRAIESHEAESDRRRAQAQRDTIYHHTGDAWRSLQARRGQRVLNAGTPGQPPRRIGQHPSRLIHTGA